MPAPTTPYPPFKPPPGTRATLSIINTTTSISNLSTHYLMTPPMPGLTTLPTLPAWSFLIESATRDPATGLPRRALYDLGVPPDWQDTDRGGFAPVTLKRLRDNGWDVRAESGVAELLEREGVPRESVGSIVWSHWHWDHIGDPSTFPSTTEVVVGPGFKEAFSPYYPEKQNSPIKASYFKNRQLREITFPTGSSSLHIGPFPAHDFFGDGSFYLLDTPGHAVGHLGGLVRTTTSSSDSDSDTFVFLGGDLCHHAGELRPSPHLPLPQSIPLPPSSRLAQKYQHHNAICPGADLAALQTQRGRAVDQPFFAPAMGADIPQAIETIEKTWLADARADVLFIFAHDAKVADVLDFWPKSMNQWRERGWRESVLWRFVEDFEGALGPGVAREGKI